MFEFLHAPTKHSKEKKLQLWLGQSVRARVVSAEFDELKGQPLMLSLGEAVHRPQYLQKIFSKPLKPQFGVDGPLMLDSGGFTMMTNPDGALPIQTIADVYRGTDADLFISLDFPPGFDETEQERSDKYRRTQENLEFLLKELGTEKLIPVVHGRTIDEVSANIDVIKARSSSWAWVGVGGIVPLLRQKNDSRLSDGRHAREHVSSIVRQTKEAFPEHNVHAFGVGAPSTIISLMALGVNSVDSIGWRSAANFGTIYLPGRPARFPTKSGIKTRHTRPALTEAEIELLENCLCPICKHCSSVEERLAKLNSSYVPRAAHNAWVVLNEVRSLESAIASGEHHHFLSSRLPSHWCSLLNL
ncbi:hypothetical protein [Kordiimonas gwangyangensis]|uniref:hypothetical protein n=1 Tax=Kordiimonas gwangyangensis TaxID=288022 RepID=UPI00036052C1|nr:hypothetical protein [Kordiimonas gwangyangensis]